MSKQFVVFRIGKERYGIHIKQVLEIIKETTLTTIPMAPAYVDGVINLRGNIITVINLHQSLGQNRIETTEKTRIIVVEVDDQQVGIVVDEVAEVTTFESSDIQPPPQTSVAQSDFVAGLARKGEELIILISLNQFLRKAESQSCGTSDKLKNTES